MVQGLRRVVRALQSFSQDIYRNYGLTAPQLWALKTLLRLGPMPVGRLAAELAVHQSSLSLLVDRLEARSLVRRRRSSQDKRVVELLLTTRGRTLAAEAPEAAQGRLRHALDQLPAARVKEIRQAVEQIVAAMEASDLEARFFFADG
ncbi:MAG TPA: MarR family winged helix-turn-helix transcriptional regulator [Gemmatimonadales bacterium]|nr:MarR family winged helix-turn-helix transcriptional regulator [Gemmatimonadales bacterium]